MGVFTVGWNEVSTRAFFFFIRFTIFANSFYALDDLSRKGMNADR